MSYRESRNISALHHINSSMGNFSNLNFSDTTYSCIIILTITASSLQLVTSTKLFTLSWWSASVIWDFSARRATKAITRTGATWNERDDDDGAIETYITPFNIQFYFNKYHLPLNLLAGWFFICHDEVYYPYTFEVVTQLPLDSYNL